MDSKDQPWVGLYRWNHKWLKLGLKTFAGASSKTPTATQKKCKHKMHEAGVGRPGTPMSFLVCQNVPKVEDWDTTLKDAEGEQVDSVRELETH